MQRWAVSVTLAIMFSAIGCGASGCGSASRSSTQTGGVAPSITTQPADQTVNVGGTAIFSVVAAGTPPLSYQWQLDGIAISGATSSSYKTPAAATNNSGETFKVVVTNPVGSATSTPATLTVSSDTTPPTVSITAPASAATVSGTIQVTATASDNVGIANVQFKVDGSNLESPVSAAPYSVSLDTTTLTNGAHALTAVATDTSQNQTTSAAVSITVSNSSTGMVPGPLRVSTANPRYFTADGTHVVLLAGSHTWANLQDQGTPSPATFDYNRFINFMTSHGFNFMHLWTWWFPNGGTAQEAPIQFSAPPFPWVRTGPGTANDGKPQFDFTQLDPNYFNRMRSRIIQAGQNGIYVSIYLFNGFEFQFDVNANDGNPFESGNNVNGVNCPNTCPTDNSLITSQVQSIEQAYLTKLIQTVNDLPNVLYAVSNESPPASTSWQTGIISFVRATEAGMPKQHPIGVVFEFSGGSDSVLYDSAADWVSPAFGGGGLNVPPDSTGQCPVQTGNGGATNPSSPNCKVVINDTDHDCGICGDQRWVWQNFTRGNNTLFMDQYLVDAPSSSFPGYNNNPGPPCTDNQCTTVDPQWDPIRDAMGDILVFANSKIDLLNMTPQDSLSTSGFCLANPGSEYLVFTTGGAFTLTTVTGTYTFEWFNPSTHSVVSTSSITVGTSQSFTPPFGSDAVLWLHQ